MMRRLSIVLVLTLAAVTWPASISGAYTATAAQAAGSLQADFNNDGFADLAVGVIHEDIGAIQEAGAVNVLYGSSSGGLNSAGNRQFWQGAAGVAGTAEAGDEFGNALAAGDFNDDGFADLAVGVFGEDVGATGDAGAVNVLFGSAGGLTGAGSQLLWQGSGGVAGSAEAGDLFGFALSAGDFNNDGVTDLAVGVAFENIGAISDAGAVNVLFGSAGGLTGAASQLLWQGAGGVAGAAEADDQFGRTLAAGDFNNNGFSDLVVGVPLENIGAVEDAGAVNVLYGTGSGLAGAGSQLWSQDSPGVVGTAESFDGFGFALAAGDFNNNGTTDLAVGVSGEDLGTISSAGAVNVLYGAGGGLAGAGSELFSQDSPGVVGTAEAGDLFGRSLAAGDFNNNGAADLAVGVPGEDIGAIRDAGAVNVLYGTGGGLSGAGSQLFQQGGGGVAGVAENDDLFGWTLSAGDFSNGGGFADLAVGVLFEDIGAIPDAGAVNVLYGAGNGLAAPGNEQFWQGAPAAGGGNIVGLAEADDQFSSALVGSDQPAASTAAASQPQSGTSGATTPRPRAT